MKKTLFERNNPNEIYSKIIIKLLKTDGDKQMIVLLYVHRYKM